MVNFDKSNVEYAISLIQDKASALVEMFPVSNAFELLIKSLVGISLLSALFSYI